MSMEDLSEQFGADVEDVAVDTGDTNEAEDQQQADGQDEAVAEREKIARALGWRPKEEYDKDDGKWMDADAFLEMRAGTKKTTERLNQVIRDQGKKIKRLETMVEQVKGFEQRAYEKALKDLKARQREAAATGDLEAFDEISTELDEMGKSAAKDVEKNDDATDTQEIFTEWLADNDWYVKDEAKRAYADLQVKKLGPMPESDMTPEEYLQEITERVNKRFAAKEEPKLRKPNPVGGANGMRVPANVSPTYASLNADEKRMAQEMVKAGIFKTVDDYAKELRK